MNTNRLNKPSWVNLTAAVLTFIFISTNLAPAYAGIITSGTVQSLESGQRVNLEVSQRILESKIVRQRLEELDFSTQEVNQRLARATDEELHLLAREADTLEAGAGVIEILVAVLLVLLILEVAD